MRSRDGCDSVEHTRRMPRLDGDEPSNRDLRAIGKHDVSDFGIDVHLSIPFPTSDCAKKLIRR